MLGIFPNTLTRYLLLNDKLHLPMEFKLEEEILNYVIIGLTKDRKWSIAYFVFFNDKRLMIYMVTGNRTLMGLETVSTDE